MRRFLLKDAPRYRRGLLLAIAAGVPLIFLRTLNDPINVPKLWWLMALLPIVIFLRVAEGLQEGSWEGLKRLWIPAAAIIGPLAIAWLFSPYKWWALFGNYPRFTGLLPYVAVALYGILIADAFRGRELDLAWAFVGAGAIVGLYGIVQVLGLDVFEWSQTDVAVSTLGNTNFAGAFLGMTLPIAAGVVAVDSDRRRWAIASLATIALACFLTRSQGGYAAAVAGSLVIGGFLFSDRNRRAPFVALFLAGLVALGVVAAVATTIFISRDAGPIPATVARRGDWWQAAGAMTKDAPLVGHGPAAFAIDGYQYRTARDGIESAFAYTDEPHSVPLAFLTSAGVIGLGGFLFAAGWLLRAGWRAARIGLLQASFLGAVVAYFVQALISIDTVALRVAFWTAAGGMLASAVRKGETSEAAPVPQKRAVSKAQRKKQAQQPLKGAPIIALTAVVSLAAVWGAFRFIRAESGVRHAGHIFAEGHPVEGAEAFESALSLRADNHYRRIYADHLGDSALAFKAEEDPRAQEFAEDFYDRTRDAYAYLEDFPHPNSIVEYARFLRAWSAFEPEVADESMAQFDRALALDPNNPALRSEVETVLAQPVPPLPVEAE